MTCNPLKSATLLVSLVGSTTAFAVISPDPFTGRYYELETNAMTWDEARVESQGRVFGGEVGHLVTIRDLHENLVIQHIAPLSDRWIGLTDSTEVSMIDGFDLSTLGTGEFGNTSGLPLPAPGTEPGGGQRGAGFRWITGESFTFHHWRNGAPGDFMGMADGVNAILQGVWQDNPAGSTLGQPGLQLTQKPFVIEYETELDQSRFHFAERRAASTFNGNGAVVTIADAETLLGLPPSHPDVADAAASSPYVISFHDPDIGVGFGNVVRAPFGLDVVGANDDFMAFRATATIEIPTPGEWTFGVAAGDVFRLRIGDNEFSGAAIMPSTAPRLTRDTAGTLTAAPGGSGETFFFPTAGTYRLELTSLEAQFFGFLQLFGAPGNRMTFDLADFDLVGDQLNGGLALVDLITVDFNLDGSVGCLDIDALVAELAAGGSDPVYDLNGDGMVSLLDRDQWLDEAGEINLGPGKTYLLGDANLDGLVDGQDFVIWNNNKFTSVAAWCSGDFNADGVVDGQDFVIWNTNKFMASDQGFGAVPEPGNWVVPWAAVLLCCWTLARARPARATSDVSAS